ncbi:hypothetical protein C6Y43_10760 [Bacillus subtilis]|nr:hypothetical protein C6Y43_10760 [Bacillus subtilis]
MTRDFIYVKNDISSYEKVKIETSRISLRSRELMAGENQHRRIYRIHS